MSTWHVRPSGGSYGDEDGTSYENAWDGLSNITWGTGGVVAGDTLYIYGVHYEVLQIGASGSAGSKIRIVFVDGAQLWPSVSLSSFTQVSTSEIYKLATSSGIYQVWEDGVLLNPEAHSADTESTIQGALDRGDYTNKASPQTLYLRCSDGAAPSTHSLRGTDRGNDSSPGVIDTNDKSYLVIENPSVRGGQWNSTYACGVYIQSGTSITVKGLHAQDCRYGAVIRGGTNIRVDEFTLLDTIGTGVYVDASNADLTNCYITKGRVERVCRMARYDSIDLQFALDGDGVGVGHAGGTITNLVLTDNVFVDCGPQYALDADIPADVTNSPDVDRGAGFFLGSSSAMDVFGLTLERNVFQDGHRYGALFGNEVKGDVRIVGNMFLRTGNAPEYGVAALYLNGTENADANWTVYNNGFVDNVQRTSLTMVSMESVDTLANVNNLFQDNDKSSDAAALSWRGDIWRSSFVSPAGDTESYNTHDTRGDLQSAVLYREAAQDYTTLSAYQTATSRGTGTTNEATNARSDGRLNGSSPAVGTGLKWWTGESPRGADGRRFMSPPSRGAYEYYGGGIAGVIPPRVKPAGADIAKARAA